jgi:hypothetical protein
MTWYRWIFFYCNDLNRKFSIKKRHIVLTKCFCKKTPWSNIGEWQWNTVYYHSDCWCFSDITHFWSCMYISIQYTDFILLVFHPTFSSVHGHHCDKSPARVILNSNTLLTLYIYYPILQSLRGPQGLNRMVVGFTMPITTKVMSSNPAHGEVYSIQHYVIKFVSDFRQVCGFLPVLRFLPPIKLTATI